MHGALSSRDDWAEKITVESVRVVRSFAVVVEESVSSLTGNLTGNLFNTMVI